MITIPLYYNIYIYIINLINTNFKMLVFLSSSLINNTKCDDDDDDDLFI